MRTFSQASYEPSLRTPAALIDALRLVREQLLIALPVGSGAKGALDNWLGCQGLAMERRLSCSSWGRCRHGPQGWAEALQALGTLRILSGAADLQRAWRRDDARPLITEMRELIKSVIDFPALRCLL